MSVPEISPHPCLSRRIKLLKGSSRQRKRSYWPGSGLLKRYSGHLILEWNLRHSQGMVTCSKAGIRSFVSVGRQGPSSQERGSPSIFCRDSQEWRRFHGGMPRQSEEHTSELQS